VHLLVLCQPVGYVADEGGRVTGLRVVRTQLGAPDDSDRRRPVEIPDSEFVLAVEMVIEAIGEATDPDVRKALGAIELTADGLVAVDPETLATSRPGVWAAGDLINGGTTVVQAVAEGLRAARLIDDYMAGKKK
jgi:glutamate synthase (NADPH/NADH) small chain